MFKPNFKYISLLFFVKYFIFYVVLMFVDNNFIYFDFNRSFSLEDIFFTLWIYLFLPITSIIIFGSSIYLAFKAKKIAYLVLVVTLILSAEYFFYVSMTSDKHPDINGLYNGFLSVLLMVVFFFKYIVFIFKGDRRRS